MEAVAKGTMTRTSSCHMHLGMHLAARRSPANSQRASVRTSERASERERERFLRKCWYGDRLEREETLPAHREGYGGVGLDDNGQ